MMSELPKLVAEKCRSMPGAAVYVVTSNDLALSDVLSKADQGVLFVYALWSGHSAASFNAFLKGFAEQRQHIPVFVVDNDDYSSCFQNVLNELPQGKGEAYWFRDGRIIYRDHGYYDKGAAETVRNRIAEFARQQRRSRAEGA